ncbi:MAG: transposase [Deltaproteobacteria bacterium]|nr:transposase [Deltaproteobacteria bacterium]
MLPSLRNFDESETARQRMKIIKFYETYGERAAVEAFGADRKVISRWKKRLKESGGSLESLIPCSTKPKNLRQPKTPDWVVKFVRELREQHPRLGKEKIKPLLDKHAAKNGLKPVSESTVGNIIKRHKFFYPKIGKVYHNPSSGWAKNKAGKKTKRLRIKHPIRPKDFGHIVADTVERITDRVKDYFYSAIDAKAKFALTLNYKRRSSENMLDFYRRFKSVYPSKVKSWQSDNGGENLGEFGLELEKEGVPHYFSYPNCPKINTYIERYNRTVQEEFIDYNLDVINDKPIFHRRLADYLIFYNTERPHKSLEKKSPVEYMIENGEMSQMCLTYTMDCINIFICYTVASDINL